MDKLELYQQDIATKVNSDCQEQELDLIKQRNFYIYVRNKESVKEVYISKKKHQREETLEAVVQRCSVIRYS